jgi:RING finger protein 113A
VKKRKADELSTTDKGAEPHQRITGESAATITTTTSTPHDAPPKEDEHIEAESNPSDTVTSTPSTAGAAGPTEDDDDTNPATALRRRIKRRKLAAAKNPNVSSTAKPSKEDQEEQAGDENAFVSKREVIPTADVHTAVDITEERDFTRRRNESNANKPKWSVGPLPQTSNVRAYSRMDYAPDVCKDYKETGYCGFGDNCKFMHDRGDYKSGWQLEKEWNAQEEAKKKKFMTGEVEETRSYEIKEDEDLPWACYICRKPFVDPVETKCKHFFCEKCALQHHAKNMKCAACNEQTFGIFNTARKLIRVLDLRVKLGQKAPAEILPEAGDGEDEDAEDPDPTLPIHALDD